MNWRINKIKKLWQSLTQKFTSKAHPPKSTPKVQPQSSRLKFVEYIKKLFIAILLLIWLVLLIWFVLFIWNRGEDLLKQENLELVINADFIGLLNILGLLGDAKWSILSFLALFLLLSIHGCIAAIKVLKNNLTNIFLYTVFVGLLSGIILIAWGVFQVDNGDISASNNKNIGTLDALDVLQRISLALPLVWLASHINALINRRAKLYVEYEHKEVVMSFYSTFKEEIKEGSYLEKAFSQGVVDVILRYPSIIGEAEETDSPLDKILNKFRSKDTKSSIDDNVIRKVIDKGVD